MLFVIVYLVCDESLGVWCKMFELNDYFFDCYWVKFECNVEI